MFGAASLTSPTPLPPALLAASSSIPSSFLAPTTAHSALSSIPVPSHPPSQLAALNACDQDIEAMDHTEGLHEVLEQVKSGLVHQLWVKYGPSLSPPKKADPLWTTIGQQISRWECLYWHFEAEFEGDMERYLTFFTYQDGVRWKVELKTRSMQLLVEDIPKQNKCLDLEAQSVAYMDKEGNFSKEQWQEREVGVKEQLGDLV